MTYAWIKKQNAGREEGGQGWPVAVMCQTLGVSRSGYYDWSKRPPSPRKQRREELAVKIRAAHAGPGQAYGSPRIHRELAGAGVRVCENTVAKVMREEGIRSVRARKFRVRTTNSAHAHPIADNLLNRDFTADLPDQKWAADISYIETDQGWLYIATVIDLCSRRIVGWAMADHMKAELCLDALNMALARRRPNLAGNKESGGSGDGSAGSGGGLIHHSDRGVQYACGAYRERLADRGIRCSMSRKGDCYDNAAMESFWATLKTELVYPLAEGDGYPTREQAMASIFKWIECWYNRKRRHSALGYKSPEEFERALN